MDCSKSEVKRHKAKGVTAALLLMAAALAGCTYSFTGASVPPHLKTIAIPAVEDQSGFGDPTLRDSFTRDLMQQFTSDNTLEISDRANADAVLEGVITDVRDAPAVLEQGENVSARRISVSVRMTFQDLKLRKKVWEKTFTQYGDYPSGGGLAQRKQGVDEAVRKLTEDILNETAAGW
ncbi:MAG: LPS assembly lipoprotein LptE [Bacteroidetes bacterium]|jgi:hypothetical protein|nr:LPS assembly lipoprotein LptE [Bacteroidota bacterium]